MQTSDRSGIICDACGLCNSNDFTYYSFDFRPIADNRVFSLDMKYSISIVSSVDICSSCYSIMSQQVIEHYKKLMSSKRSARHPQICELTGRSIVSNYYYCTVIKVDVRMTGQPNICVNCQKKTFDVSQPCQCGNVNFIRPALINTITRFLEFDVCADAFQEICKKSEAVRVNTTKWTTQS